MEFNERQVFAMSQQEAPLAPVGLVHYPLWIDGARVAATTDEALTIYNPATSTPIATVAHASSDDVDQAVRAARNAFFGAWAKVSAPKRAKTLAKLADLIRNNAATLAKLESDNTGKPAGAAQGEVMHAAEVFDYYAAFCGKVTGDTVPTLNQYLCYTTWEPMGVVAAIIPWNFPLVMAAWKLAPALAAGNTVVLKPSELTPLTALALAELATEAGIPAGVLNVVNGFGERVGDLLTRHTGVNKVAFTGGTETGRAVMRNAADGIKRVTLELGGKSPGIVFDDANLDEAVAGAIYAIYDNAGQACNARSRLFVQDGIYDAFVAAFSERAQKLVVGGPSEPGSQIGALITAEHWQRVDGYVKLGVAEGARVLFGGKRPDDLSEGHFYLPTALVDVNNDMRVAQEEIFGPVAVIMRFKSEAEVIDMANRSPYGLYGTIWTRDAGRGHRVAAKIQSGGLTINTPFSSFVGVPFGGMKQSGFGRELGAQTMKQYMEEKSVLVYTGEKTVNPFGV